MKKNLIIITIFLSLITNHFFAKGQIVKTIDNISLSQFDIVPNGSKIIGQNTLVLNSTQFIQKFGKSIKTSQATSEEYDQVVNDYSYTGADAWYMSNKLLAINITNANYVLQTVSGLTIKVGDSAKELVSLFPNSWALTQNGQVIVGLKNYSNTIVDMNIIFDFNSSGVITAIAAQ